MSAETKTVQGPASRPRAGLTTLLGGAALGFLGYLAGGWAARSSLIRERMSALSGLDLLALPLLVLFVLAVHEGGHLLGGLRKGMRFLLCIVGPFQVTRTARGLRFNWLFSPSTMGGLVAAAPDPRRPLRPQLLSLIAGGPLASLALGFAGLAVAGLDTGRAGAYGFFFGAVSLLIFLVTAIPTRMGGLMSDGMQLVDVIRGGRAVEERQALFSLMAQSLAGTRPRDLDAALLQEAQESGSADSARRTAVRLYAYLAAVDSRDSRAHEHARWLAENIEAFPAGFRQGIAVELALHEAGRGDLQGARRWMLQARGGIVDASRRALADANLAVLEGDLRRAEGLLAVAQEKLSSGFDPGLNALTAEQIHDTLSRMRSGARA